jgi:hypothetical protein
MEFGGISSFVNTVIDNTDSTKKYTGAAVGVNTY